MKGVGARRWPPFAIGISICKIAKSMITLKSEGRTLLWRTDHEYGSRFYGDNCVAGYFFV
jgi:hypothetical protein